MNEAQPLRVLLCFRLICFMNVSKLTFTIRYNDVRISASSSVPKIADMWDMGL